MRSRALPLIFSIAAFAAFTGAGLFINSSERRIASTRDAAQAFDVGVRETTSGIGEFRVSEAAYVAAGQGVAFWMPRVATAVDGVAKSLDALRAMANTDKARAALDEAAAKAASFTAIDRRAQDYVNTGLPLMAGDAIFADGAETAAFVLDHVSAARISEQQAADAAERSQRKLEAAILAAAAIIGLLALGGMPIARPAAAVPELAQDHQSHESHAVSEPAPAGAHSDELLLRGTAGNPSKYVTARPAGPVLQAASRLCTDLGRVSDIEELRGLIGQAAELMDASGLMVWMRTADGSELRPALSHGYPAEMLARLPALGRSADNAAATAYRTAQLQIVLAHPGSSNGAVVAPLLSSEGCVGVISAEIRGGGEASESVQALAVIFAAQLAGVFHATPQAHEQRATGT
jgi:hypothetical protein